MTRTSLTTTGYVTFRWSRETNKPQAWASVYTCTIIIASMSHYHIMYSREWNSTASRTVNLSVGRVTRHFGPPAALQLENEWKAHVPELSL